MPRVRKPAVLEKYHYRDLNLWVDLYLDNSDHSFFFVLNGVTYREKSMDALKNRAFLELEKLDKLEWMPVICIKKLEPFAEHSRQFIGFVPTRKWIAKKPDGSWISHEWVELEEGEQVPDPAEQRREWLRYADYFAGREFALYSDKKDFRSDRYFVVEYSEALWGNLLAICDRIEAMRDHLDQLLCTREGVAKITAVGTRLMLMQGGK